MKTIVLLLALLAIGCGNNRNPVTVSKEDVVTEIEAGHTIRIVNTVSAPAAKAVGENEILTFEVEYTITYHRYVLLEFHALSGRFMPNDRVSIYLKDEHGNEARWGVVSIPEGAPWASFKIDLLNFPVHEKSVIIVRIDRDDATISDSEIVFESIEPLLEIKDITIAHHNELVISFWGVWTLSGMHFDTLSLDRFANGAYEEIGVDSFEVDSDNATVTIITKEDIEPGQYRLSSWEISLSRNSLWTHSHVFEVEGERVQTGDGSGMIGYFEEFGRGVALSFKRDVVIENRREAIQNTSIVNETLGTVAVIKDILIDRYGYFVILTEEDLNRGPHTLVYTGGDGLRYDHVDNSASLPPFEYRFEVATRSGQDHSDIETNHDDRRWMTVQTGTLSDNGSDVTSLIKSAGIFMTRQARSVIEGTWWQIEDRGEIDLFIVTEEDLGLSGDYTLHEVKVAIGHAGYQSVPVETTVLALLESRDPVDGHLLFVSETLLGPDDDLYLLVITGQENGNWLAAHRFPFPDGDNSRVLPGHRFVVTNK